MKKELVLMSMEDKLAILMLNNSPNNLLNDSAYTFQGYLVYQLKNATVSVTDLDDPDLARLVFRSDINDTVTGIVNQYLDPVLGVYTPVEEVASVLSDGVKGSVDEGTEYSFQITDDKFALGNTRLVNHKTYYFMSIAYGYCRAEENADPYNVNDPEYDGRNQPYIGGRRNCLGYFSTFQWTSSCNRMNIFMTHGLLTNGILCLLSC